MNIAAMGAIMKGDLEDTIAALTPGGIERQERSGQIEQGMLETLPIEGTNGEARAKWEALGFTFGEAYDDLFVNVTFPPGWKKNCSDRAYWTQVLDERGRVRANLFYKAAFYDRKARAHFAPRFSCSAYEDGSTKDHFAAVIWDGGKVLKSFGESHPDDNEGRKRMKDAMEAWLHENYPDWENRHAYWD